jgi:hypothetical protein
MLPRVIGGPGPRDVNAFVVHFGQHAARLRFSSVADQRHTLPVRLARIESYKAALSA